MLTYADAKGDDQLARGRVPELGSLVCARCQDPRTVWTKRRMIDNTLMGKGGDQLARGRVPELGSFVPACRQDPSTIRTKVHANNRILMGKGGDERRQRLFTMNDEFLEESL